MSKASTGFAEPNVSVPGALLPVVFLSSVLLFDQSLQSTGEKIPVSVLLADALSVPDKPWRLHLVIVPVSCILKDQSVA